MPILNYRTTVKADRTIEEITRMLAKGHASAVLTEFEDGRPVGLAFRLMTPGGQQEFALPCRWKQVQIVLTQQRVDRQYRSDAHSLDVAWRILKDWTEAQLAIIQAGMVSMDEVFLPYRLFAPGQTVYQRMLLLEAKD